MSEVKKKWFVNLHFIQNKLTETANYYTSNVVLYRDAGITFRSLWMEHQSAC